MRWFIFTFAVTPPESTTSVAAGLAQPVRARGAHAHELEHALLGGRDVDHRERGREVPREVDVQVLEHAEVAGRRSTRPSRTSASTSGSP